MIGKTTSRCCGTTITSLSAVLPENGVVVFDLDDTLYPERAFVQSGFRAVGRYIERNFGTDVYERSSELLATGADDPFGGIIAEFGLPLGKSQLVNVYRTHIPELALAEDVRELLTGLCAA